MTENSLTQADAKHKREADTRNVWRTIRANLGYVAWVQALVELDPIQWKEVRQVKLNRGEGWKYGFSFASRLGGR